MEQRNAPLPPKPPVSMEPERMKRVTASRQYAQKYRMKQINYMQHLEQKVQALEAEIELIRKGIKHSNFMISSLQIENQHLKERNLVFSGELTFKQAQYGELRGERDMLKQMYEGNWSSLAEMFEEPAALAPALDNINTSAALAEMFDPQLF